MAIRVKWRQNLQGMFITLINKPTVQSKISTKLIYAATTKWTGIAWVKYFLVSNNKKIIADLLKCILLTKIIAIQRLPNMSKLLSK